MGFIWHLCIANMKKRGIRTGLTILGVVIGVISVVSMLALGLGVKNELLSDAMMDGSVTDITIYGSNEGKRKDRMITDRRIKAIGEIPHVSGVTPMLNADAQIHYDRYVGYINLTGVPRSYLEAMKPVRGTVPEVNGTRLELLMGTGALNMFYNENTGVTYPEAKAPSKEEQERMDEEDAELAEEGAGYWDDVQQTGREDGVSQSNEHQQALSIEKAAYTGAKRWNDWSGEYLEVSFENSGIYLDDNAAETAAGTAGEDDTAGTGTVAADVSYGSNQGKSLRTPVAGMLNEYNYGIYCDMDTLKKILKRNSADGRIAGQPTDKNGNALNEWVYSYAVVKVDDVEYVDTVVKRLSDMGYQAESNKEYVDEVQREIKIIQILLGGIGAIALVVAVIGIGNTMTTSVYDRINEIGILKVLGCDPDELMGLFLLESGILGGIGGIIGLICSYGISAFGINRLGVKLLEMPKNTQLAVIPGWLAFASVVLAVVLGVAAGYLPAKWASKMKPIDAVRRN